MNKTHAHPTHWLAAVGLILLPLGAAAEDYNWSTLGAPLNIDSTKQAEFASMVTSPIEAGGTSRLCVAWYEADATAINRVHVKHWNGSFWETLGTTLNPAGNHGACSVNLGTYPENSHRGLFIAWDDVDVPVPGAKNQVFVKQWNGADWIWPTGNTYSANYSVVNSATRPCVTVYDGGSNQYAYAAWQENVGTNNRVYVKTWFTGETTWTIATETYSGREFLNYDSTRDARDPKIAYADYYTTYVFWLEADASGKYLLHAEQAYNSFGQFRLSDYTVDGAGVTLNAAGTTVQHFDMAIDRGNPVYTYDEPLLAWAEGNAGSFDIRAARFTFNSGTYSYEAQFIGGAINTNPLVQNPTIYVGQDHVPYVAWEEQANAAAPYIIKVKRYNGAAWESVAGDANINPARNASGPSLGWQRSEPISVAFSEETGGPGHLLYVRSAQPGPAATPTPTATATMVPGSLLPGESISAYPMPAATQVTFALNTQENGPVVIKVYNTRFRLVKELTGTSVSGRALVQWDVSGISPGIYFYHLTINGRKFSARKLVVAR